MSVLKDYKQFNGHHWETGSVHNLLAYQRAIDPHTKKPYSEALLLGISGGIAFGYFGFAYAGYDPQLVILTRNTFDPMQTFLQRLGILQTTYQTTGAKKAQLNLDRVLEEGRAALVWADMCSLSYNGFDSNKDYWAMLPLVVYGHDKNSAYIADRSSQSLQIPADELAAARARVKKDKFRLITLENPITEKLPAAVLQGLWQCIRLFTEKPPRGTRKNFGLTGYEHWAKMLTNTRNTQSWERYYPAGAAMFSALVGAKAFPGLYTWTLGFGDGGAERGRYADFLEEAALILSRPALEKSATVFRNAQVEWIALGRAALSDNIPLFKSARKLLDRRAISFWEKGTAARPELLEINKELISLREQADKSFPLTGNTLKQWRFELAGQVLKIREIEKQAIQLMQDALG